MIIAVDFDGTLCKHRFPEIGPPNQELIDLLIETRNNGHLLILWTCRENIAAGKYLDQAVEWAAEQGLYFDGVNANIENMGGFAGRKILADIYIDDRSLAFDRDKLIEQLKEKLNID